ncbi:MAG: hypothetical protein HOW97_36020 [Catenulispora sp.]|nr:hypothetical protein [Catenulispora sp.]
MLTKRNLFAAALLLMVMLEAGGCGGDASKPQRAIAGCDARPGGPDVTIRFVTRELRDLNLVTGVPRRTQFDALFDDGHIKADSTYMIGWINRYGNDRDIAIYGIVPASWHIPIENQFPNLDAEYRAYCTGWSFDKFAREYGETHPNG